MIIDKNNIVIKEPKDIGMRLKKLRSSIRFKNPEESKKKYLPISNIEQQKILADYLNCDERKIWQFERGNKIPTVQEMKILSDFFKISIDFLYFGTLENYVKHIFTAYMRNSNKKIEMGLCLDSIKIKKIVYHFNLELDKLGTNHELITYPKYQTVIRYAATQGYLPVVTPDLNIKSIKNLYGDNVWGIIADQFCYFSTSIENKKYKKIYRALIEPLNKYDCNFSLNYQIFESLTFSYKRILTSNDSNYIPFEEIVKDSSTIISLFSGTIDNTSVKHLSDKKYFNINSSIHNFNTLNPYHNITKKKSTYCGPIELNKLYKDNAF